MILKQGNNLLTNLESYWKLNGNANDSIGSRNGTEVGTVTYPSGKIFQCADLENAHINFTAYTLPSQWTFSCWFMPLTEDMQTYKAIFATQAVSFGFYFVQAGINKAIMYDGLNPYNYCNSFLPIDRWSMLTFVYNNGVGQWYLNGEVDSPKFTGVLNGYLDMIGGLHPSFNSNEHIDECGIWSRCLDGNDILDLYNRGSGLDLQFFKSQTSHVLKNGNNLITDLAHYYKFNNNSIDAVGGDNGTDTDITYVSGKIFQGASWNGTSSKIDISPIARIPGQEQSINFWINHTNTSPNQFDFGGLFCKTGDTNPQGLFHYRGSFSQIDYGGGNISAGTGVMSPGWQMVTLTFDVNNISKFYINGVQLPDAADGVADHSFDFGVFGTTGINFVLYYLQTQLDEFGFWNRVLTKEDMADLYNSGHGLDLQFFKATPFETVLNARPNLTVGLIASYNFDGDATDVLGNHDLSLSGSFSYGTPSKVNQSLLTIGSYVAGTCTPTPMLTDFTYSFWFNPTSNTTVTAAFFNKIPFVNGLYFNWINNTFSYSDNGPTLNSPSVALNTFILFTLTVRNGIASMYIDGKLASRATGFLSTFDIDNFGYGGYFTYLSGSIDILSIWNRALTEEEILLYYNNGNGLQYPFN